MACTAANAAEPSLTNVHGVPGALKDRTGEILIHRDILSQQKMPPLTDGRVRRGLQDKSWFACYGEFEGEPKGRAVANDALNSDGSAHALDERFGDS